MSQKLPAHKYLIQELLSIIDKVRTISAEEDPNRFALASLTTKILFILRTLVSIDIPDDAQKDVMTSMQEVCSKSMGLTDVGPFNLQHCVREAEKALTDSA